MDQLRTALAWLKRHHFWVLSGVIALIALGCWWKGTSTFSAKYDTDQKLIQGEFTNLKTERDKPFHPNEGINQRQGTEVTKQSEDVLKVWEKLYEKQRETVLKWPQQLAPEFRDDVEKKQFGDDIGTFNRNIYQNYIEQHFPELPKIVGAREMLPTETGAGGMEGGRRFSMNEGIGAIGPGGVPLVEDDDQICEWFDQDIVRKDLDFPQRPRALRIWKTQEDLWVYHTLLDAIAKTNQLKGATRKSNAAVKAIISLEVGQRAAHYSRTPGRLLMPPAMAAATPMGPEGGPAGPGGVAGPEGGAPARGAEMMMGERGGGDFGNGGALSPADEQRFLLSDRYLDANGQPIPLGGGAAAGGEAAPMGPEGGGAPAVDPNAPAPPLDMAQFGICYKRLPVRMVLHMDVRWLPQLISACANQPLRVEVQEVRINTPDIEGMATSGGGMGGFRGGFEGGRPGGGMGGGSLFPDRNGLQNFPAQPNVVTVAIQGTIFIYNKPNPALLKSSIEQPAAGGDAAATPPAATGAYWRPEPRAYGIESRSSQWLAI
jgi:hypothetical protein